MFSNAEAYERFMGRWSRLVASLFVDFADIPHTGRVLDAGSGTGSLAFTVAERRPATRVTGIDPSEEYVGYASARNRFGDRVSFQRGDAQRLEFGDRSFGASVSLLVFNFIPDPEKALRELIRVTERNGTICAAVWDYGDRMGMLRAFWDAVIRTDPAAERLDEKHMRLCRAGELASLWKRAQLTNIREKPIEVVMRFSSFSDYWEPFLLGQGPAGAYARTLEPDRLRKLRDAAKVELGVESETTPIDLPARVWAVRGSVPS